MRQSPPLGPLSPPPAMEGQVPLMQNSVRLTLQDLLVKNWLIMHTQTKQTIRDGHHKGGMSPHY